MITFSYFTNRKEPKIHWFFDSLAREAKQLGLTSAKLVVVDFYALSPRRKEIFQMKYDRSGLEFDYIHVPPKPSVWQGPHRLTKSDFFAAANARNTALCLAPDGYLVCADDLAVLLPGWLTEVLLAHSDGHVAAGAYMKVRELKVRKGQVIHYQQFPEGIDTRYGRLADPKEPHIIGGGELYGASMGAPVEALLRINGWDEDCDSMGSEDYICGMMLEHHGYPARYHPKMMTYESEELHYKDTPMSRIIKPMKGVKDATWQMLNWVKGGARRYATNYQSMSDTRDLVLGGGEFPIIQCPEHDWRDGQPLREMGNEDGSPVGWQQLEEGWTKKGL